MVTGEQRIGMRWAALGAAPGRSPDLPLPQAVAGDVPTLAVHEGMVHCVHRNSGTLAWTYYEPASAHGTRQAGWSPRRTIGVACMGFPGLASYPQKLHCVYRARSHSSSVLRTLVLDEDGTWQPGTQLADDAMSDPVVAVHDARLHLAYRGFPKPGSTRPVTNYRIFDGARWSAATALPPADAQGFGLISYAGTLHCAYRAGVPGRAGRLLHSSFDGAAWSAPVVIHEGPGWGRPTLAVHDGKLYAAYSVRAEPSEPASFEDAGKGRSHGRMPQPTNEPVGQTQQEVTGVHRATDPDFRQDALIKYSSFDGTTWSVPTTVATGVRTPGEEIAPALTAYRDQDSGEETLLLLYPTVVEETAP